MMQPVNTLEVEIPVFTRRCIQGMVESLVITSDGDINHLRGVRKMVTKRKSRRIIQNYAEKKRIKFCYLIYLFGEYRSLTLLFISFQISQITRR